MPVWDDDITEAAPPWQWDDTEISDRFWEGEQIVVRPWEDDEPHDSVDQFFIVMCPVSGKRVHRMSDLRRRWDGVLVSKEAWDPEPRHYRKQSSAERAEVPLVRRADGTLTFANDTEGR